MTIAHTQDGTTTPIVDEREWAGRELGGLVESLRAEDPIVVGIVRGGVPVACAVAQALAAPLEIAVVRKIQLPGDAPYTIGAVAEDGSLVLEGRSDERQVQNLVDRAVATCDVLATLYRGGRCFPSVRGRTVILVDDAISTGATARAATRLVRRAGAAKVVVAVPFALAPAVEKVRPEVDELFALRAATPFEPIRCSYASLEKMTDEQVLACLHRMAARGAPARRAASRPPASPGAR
jgi:putative phosphoribosyl transferase